MTVSLHRSISTWDFIVCANESEVMIMSKSPLTAGIVLLLFAVGFLWIVSSIRLFAS